MQQRKVDWAESDWSSETLVLYRMRPIVSGQ